MIIDTDVLINYLRGDSQTISFLEKALTDSICYISTISIAELYVDVKEKEREILDQFIYEFEIAFLNDKMAQKGGLYRQEFGKSHGVGLADALVAATAEILDLELVTFNKKHYPMSLNVRVPYKAK